MSDKPFTAKQFLGAWVAMTLFALTIWAGLLLGACLIIKAVFA